MTGADVASRLRDTVQEPSKLHRNFDSLVSEMGRGLDEVRHHRKQITCRVERVLPRRPPVWVCEGPIKQNQRESKFEEGDYIKVGVTLPVFNGSSLKLDFLDWLDTFQDYFEVVNLTDAIKCKLVASKLRGAARTWWKELQHTRFLEGKNPITSWSRMSKLLIKKFLHTSRLSYLHNQSSKLSDEGNLGNAKPVNCSTKCLVQSYSNKAEISMEDNGNGNSSSAVGGAVEEQSKEIVEGKHATCSINAPLEPEFDKHDEENEVTSLRVSEPTCKDVNIETLEKTTSQLLSVGGIIDHQVNDSLEAENTYGVHIVPKYELEKLKLLHKKAHGTPEFEGNISLLTINTPTTVKENVKALAEVGSDSCKHDSSFVHQPCNMKMLGKIVIRSFDPGGIWKKNMVYWNTPQTIPFLLYDHKAITEELVGSYVAQMCKLVVVERVCSEMDWFWVSLHRLLAMVVVLFDPGGKRQCGLSMSGLVQDSCHVELMRSPGTSVFSKGGTELRIDENSLSYDFDASAYKELKERKPRKHALDKAEENCYLDLSRSDVWKPYGYCLTEDHCLNLKMLGAIVHMNFDPGGKLRNEPNSSDDKEQSVVMNVEPMGEIALLDESSLLFATCHESEKSRRSVFEVEGVIKDVIKHIFVLFNKFAAIKDYSKFNESYSKTYDQTEFLEKSLCRVAYRMKTHDSAIYVVSLASNSETLRKCLFEECAFRLLVRKIESCSMPLKERAAALAMESINSVSKNSWAISAYGGEEGAVPVLLQLLFSGNAHVHEKADYVAILAISSNYFRNLTFLFDPGGCPRPQGYGKSASLVYWSISSLYSYLRIRMLSTDLEKSSFQLKAHEFDIYVLKLYVKESIEHNLGKSEVDSTFQLPNMCEYYGFIESMLRNWIASMLTGKLVNSKRERVTYTACKLVTFVFDPGGVLCPRGMWRTCLHSGIVVSLKTYHYVVVLLLSVMLMDIKWGTGICGYIPALEQHGVDVNPPFKIEKNVKSCKSSFILSANKTYRFHGLVDSREGCNVTKLRIITLFTCILCDNELVNTLRLFYKLVNGLDPPMMLDDPCPTRGRVYFVWGG